MLRRVSEGSRLYICTDCETPWVDLWGEYLCANTIRATYVEDLCEECRRRFRQYLRRYVRKSRWPEEWVKLFESLK